MKDNTKSYSSKQENMVANLLGWKVVAGSGAAACFPGDVISDEWLGECKTHVARGHKVEFMKAHWDKIKQEAAVKRRFPILFTDDGSQKPSRTWCLCMADRLEMEDVHKVSINTGAAKNISFDHEIMAKQHEEALRHHPGEHPIFTCTWHGDSIAICQLVVLVDLIGE